MQNKTIFKNMLKFFVCCLQPGVNPKKLAILVTRFSLSCMRVIVIHKKSYLLYHGEAYLLVIEKIPVNDSKSSVELHLGLHHNFI